MGTRTCACRHETVCFRAIDAAGPAQCWPCQSGNHSHGYGAAPVAETSAQIERLTAIQVAAEEVLRHAPQPLDATAAMAVIPRGVLVTLHNAVRAAREG